MVISLKWILPEQLARYPQDPGCPFLSSAPPPGEEYSRTDPRGRSAAASRGPRSSCYTRVSKLAYNAVFLTGDSGYESCKYKERGYQLMISSFSEGLRRALS